MPLSGIFYYILNRQNSPGICYCILNSMCLGFHPCITEYCCGSGSKGSVAWDILMFHPIKKKLDMVQQKQDWTWATKSNEVESLIPDLEIGRTYTVQPMRAEKLPNGRHAVMVYVCELGEFRTFPAGCFGKYIFTLGEEFPKAKFRVVVSKSEINGKMTKSWKVELA